MSEVKKAEPTISLPRRIWRWWQIPILAWIVLLMNERIDDDGGFLSLMTLPGVFMMCGIVSYILVTEIINVKLSRHIENEPSESMQKFFYKYGLDKIRFRTVDTYRFWHHYAGACKMLGRTRSRRLQTAHRKVKELKEELLIIKLAKI